MPVCKTDLEKKLFGALKRITQYQAPQRLLKNAEKEWGLDPHEALEMAYENIQQEAKDAVKGVRLPKS